MSALAENVLDPTGTAKECEEDGKVPVMDEGMMTAEEGDGDGGASKENAPIEKQKELIDGDEEKAEVEIQFKLAYGRQMFDITAPANQPVTAFADTVQKLTNVPPAMQKLVCRGSKLLTEQTLADAKVTSGAKVLLIGSTAAQVEEAKAKPTTSAVTEVAAASTSKEPLSKQKMHAKIIDQGPPDDEALPPTPLRGMRNKQGRAVRLTFKLELDQLWIGTPERTEKVPMGNINDIVSEPIDGREEHSIIGIGVGSTELSRVWIYWVPSQYVTAIRRATLD